MNPVTVIVPVYGGLEYTERCLESVLRHAGATSRWSCSSSTTRRRSCRSASSSTSSRRARRRSRSTVLHNAENLGFVRTVNHRSARGARRRRHPELRHGRHRRLARPARGRGCPVRCGDGHATDQPRFDLHAARRGDRRVRPRRREPTHRRLRDVRARKLAASPARSDHGRRLLHVRDAPRPRPVRAARRGHVRTRLRRGSRLLPARGRVGLRHLVDDATFVYHRGGVSFGDGQTQGWSRSSAIIDARYPFFRPSNTHERVTDPLAVSFAALELALDARDGRRPHVLQMTHSRLDATGGTEKYVAALLATLDHDFDFSVLYPVESGFVLRTNWMRRRPPRRARVPPRRRGQPGDAHERRGRARGAARSAGLVRRSTRSTFTTSSAIRSRRSTRSPISTVRSCAPCTTCSSRARTSRCST